VTSDGGAREDGARRDGSNAATGVAELEARLEEAQAQRLRMAADFANFRRRALQQQTEATRQGAGAVAERILSVLDDLERAIEHAPPGVEEGWLRGIELTIQRLRDELASIGIEPIEAVGSQFDPALHEAVDSVESTEHAPGTVVEEVRRGYRMQDDVLRPSLVKLARRPDGEGTGQPH